MLLLMAVVSAFTTGIGFRETPVVTDGIIYRCVWEDRILFCSVDSQGDGEDGMLAFDLDSCDRLWFTPSVMEGSGFGSPWDLALRDGRLFMIVNGLGFLCMDSATGTVEYLWPSAEGIIASAVQGDGVVFVASKTSIAALDADTGLEIWRYDESPGIAGMHPTITNLHLAGHRLYAGSIMPSVRCFDARTGELLWWSTDIMDSGGAGYAIIRYACDGLVYVSTASDEITVLDASTGRPVRYLEGYGFLAGDDRSLYIYSVEDEESSILVIDPDAGETVAEFFPENDPWNSETALSAERMLMGTADGYVLLLGRDPNDGNLTLEHSSRMSDRRPMVAHADGWLTAVSEEGRCFAARADGGPPAEGDSGMPAVWHIVSDGEGRLCFASGGSAVLLVDGQ